MYFMKSFMFISDYVLPFNENGSQTKRNELMSICSYIMPLIYKVAKNSSSLSNWICFIYFLAHTIEENLWSKRNFLSL